MEKRALVTGATGFIGSNLARRLIKGGWHVDVVVRPSSDLRLISDLRDAVNVIEFDGSIGRLSCILERSRPDVVFHVASLFLSNHNSDQVQQLVESNLHFGVQLLESMANSGVKLFINTSTSWEHYQGDEYNPVNLYAATKKAFQQLQQFYIEAKGFQVITLKLFDTYGPGDIRPKILNLLLKAAKDDQPIGVTPGDQKLDFVHIDDVVESYMLAAKRLMAERVTFHEEYGVGSGSVVTLKDIVILLEEKLGKNIIVNWGERPYAIREIMESTNNYKTINGWAPKISLSRGLEALVRSAR
jgi:nucleoside-diphosphate-sugar epimerase